MPNQDGANTNANDAGNDPHQAAIARWTRKVGLFTLALVAVSTVSDYFIYEQWQVASKQANNNREQLRAFVTRQVGAFGHVGSNGVTIDSYGIAAQFQNVGGTRTSKFKAWISLHYFDGTVPNNIDLSKSWDTVDLQDSVIGHNLVAQLTPLGLSVSDVQKVLNKTGVILVWGSAEWADVFNPEVTHRISYCALVTPVSVMVTPAAQAPPAVKAASSAASQGPAQSPQIQIQLTPYKNDCNQST